MGNPIISNGSTLSGKSNDGSRSRNNRRFICGTLGKTFKKSVAMPITKSMQYRETSLIKNRKNNRPDGQTGPKRRKVVGSTAKCPFSFTVKWDHRGFYVELKQNAGDPCHKFHPQILKPTSMSFPTRLLSEEQLDDTKEVVSATCNKGVGRNFIRGKFGRFINSIKIAYVNPGIYPRIRHISTIHKHNCINTGCVAFMQIPIGNLDGDEKIILFFGFLSCSLGLIPTGLS